MGKKSFGKAFVMDTCAEERKRGITINCNSKMLETKTKEITIIDAPGHRDFIKNMITGTSQSDHACLIVSYAKGEFESGISKNGQTNEHCILAQALGVTKIIVCVNKMDLEDDTGTKFSEKRFNEIKGEMQRKLKSFGFKSDQTKFIPISSLAGENTVKYNSSDKMSWYKGESLIQALDNLEPPERNLTGSFRMPIGSCYKVSGVGTILAGQIVRGVAKPKDQVMLEPGTLPIEIKTVEMHKNHLDQGAPGENVGLSVKGVKREEVKKGMVLGSVEDPPFVSNQFQVKAIIMNIKNHIKVGYTPVLHCHTATVPCKIVKISSIIDQKTGKKVVSEFVKKNQTCTLTFEPLKPLCCDTYKACAKLGRVTIRDQNFTCGIGFIRKITGKKEAAVKGKKK